MRRGRRSFACFQLTIVMVAWVLLPVPGRAQSIQLPETATLEQMLDPAYERPALDGEATGTVIRENELLGYCMNITDLATETRNAILQESLSNAEAEVDAKLAVLEEKMATFEEWLKKREEFLQIANQSLIEIYKTMRPDAAAERMTELDPVVSAAIIAKLDPKVAGAILQEMKPDRAATITLVLSSAGETENATN